MKRICVIGGGRWGQNHIRTLFQMANLAGIVEADSKRLNELLEKYPVQSFSGIETALEVGFDGYVVATPAPTHYSIAKVLLEQGQNVLIEKPMTLSSTESSDLISIAEQSGARLMVGHLLLFHPAIIKIKELIETGYIGELRYLYSNRLNMGTIRTEENVFWSFAPHDISVIDYLVAKPAINVTAKGMKILRTDIPDMVMTQIAFPQDINAHIFVSWIHPFKEQRLVVIGDKGMLTFEDTSADKNVIFYQKLVKWVDGQPIIEQKPDEIIAYEKSMPLNDELQYFINNLEGNIEKSGGQSGYQVVKMLEKVQELLDQA